MCQELSDKHAIMPLKRIAICFDGRIIIHDHISTNTLSTLSPLPHVSYYSGRIWRLRVIKCRWFFLSSSSSSTSCEIVCRSDFANVNIVFLICLMFIFERPIQITLFRIHLVSVLKICYLLSPFMDKQRQHSLRYLPDLTQQYFNSTSAVFLSCNVAYANYLGRKAPSGLGVVFVFLFFGLQILHSGHLVCGNM